jgi:tight adherence protein B
VAAVSIATMCALGMMCIAVGAMRFRQRALTSRRVADVLGEAVGEHIEVSTRVPRAWRWEAHQLAAQIAAHDDALRGPAVVVACVAVLIGLASLSAAWFGIAGFSALAAYALGGRRRDRQRIETQSLGAMGLFASGLRAGYSVQQAIQLVGEHSPQPTAREFTLIGQEVGVGIDLPEAIARMARRTANKDYELVAIIVRVQHEVGGNLAQILDSVGSTLRERVELRRQVNALTAQQRLSSMVLTVLPFALLTFLFVMDRSFVDPLFTEPVGRVILAIAGAMVLIGWSIMRSIGRVEV